MQYKKLTGIVLKKQNYREADQILTVWTKEAGKVRVLAKSIRLPKSKLVYAVTDLGVSEIEITGKHLPVLINAKSIRQFMSLREELQKTAIGLYAAELMLKMTADEHPNQTAFNLLSDFLIYLDQPEYFPTDYELLDKFSLNLLACLGFKFPEVSNPTHTTINKFIEYIIERPVWMTKF
ncbi:MAG: DNA repair protein RecO [Candidatus Doudnabacteria bacterium RIFCSPHIGHO2_01_FULL_45_18]|uniref:DNA repair protein RecO n=1 Tax=Candidatus Doudnabacteria bacterium RIFCSPHIGHO2_01_FULL_45_18 TaxID=1817823 RepID=A0A1F5NTC3_9BACT|nr:MAG: DNA repair protein RecO [Candidatus Doudnabacteria bacterium RIFCSPHIGHO2_01_FULL_45_18]